MNGIDGIFAGDLKAESFESSLSRKIGEMGRMVHDFAGRMTSNTFLYLDLTAGEGHAGALMTNGKLVAVADIAREEPEKLTRFEEFLVADMAEIVDIFERGHYLVPKRMWVGVSSSGDSRQVRYDFSSLELPSSVDGFDEWMGVLGTEGRARARIV